MHNTEAMLLILVIVFSVCFDYVNGFHDTANAIATVVSTRVLTPRAAILMAAILNFVGALVSSHVAQTIAHGLVDPRAATQLTVLSAVLGAIVWNLVTWRYGIPSSSSHALIGGLCGAALTQGWVVAMGRPGRISAAALDRILGMVQWAHLLDKVVYPLIGSPVVGFAFGFGIMALLYLLFAHRPAGQVRKLFQRLQMLSAAAVAFNHGQNDAQKSMGIITLALVSFHVLPMGDHVGIPLWVIVLCASAMALGTSAGGYRIMKTMGHRILRLDPVQGFAAETAASITIFCASLRGMPVSTTHVIAGSIFGVGSSKRLSAVRWGVAQTMIVAWVLTIPASALVAGLVYLGLSRVSLR